LRIGEYRLEPGQSASARCVPITTSTFSGSSQGFAGVERVDIEFRISSGEARISASTTSRFDRAHDEIVLIWPGDRLRSLPKQSIAIEVRARGPSGERSLATYALHHTPWA
jgi:hypothetical protein